MNKVLLPLLSLFAASTTISQAYIDPSQTTIGGVQTTIDCFDFNLTSATTGAGLVHGDTIQFEGNLTGGTYLPDISGYGIQSHVSLLSGTTTASFSGGVLTFTGSVGLITTTTNLEEAKGLGKDCRTLDFSFTQCTTIEEGSKLADEIKTASETRGTTVYYGIKGDLKQSLALGEITFEKGAYTFDTADYKITDETDSQRLEFYSVNDKTTKSFENTNDTITTFKDFKVCVECTELVPEPSSTALLGLGALSLLIRRKR